MSLPPQPTVDVNDVAATAAAQSAGGGDVVGQLLDACIARGASDLHITPGSPPIGRIDGELVPLT
jgi:hypothetical protein